MISNSGFEFKKNSESYPDNLHQVARMTEWEDDLDEKNCDPDFHNFHSPEWYYSDNTHLALKKTIGGALIQARTEFGYVGMSKGELIQQQLHNNLEIDNTQEYVVSLYFKFPGATGTTNGVPHMSVNPSQSFQLKVYIATSKIHYKEAPINCENVNDWLNSDQYCELKDGIFNDIREVASFDLSSSTYPIDQWHKLTKKITPPSNNSNYNWIAFEVKCNGENGASNKYIIIDDLSLQKYCDLNCTKTSGIPNPQIATFANASCAQAQISNIQNVREIKLEVFTMLGVLIRTQQFYNTNGFSVPVYWDGKTQSGAEAAPASYIVKATCINDCGTFEFSNTIVHTCQIFSNPPDVVSQVLYTDCCEINHFFNGETFSLVNNLPYPYSYHPQHGIYANNCSFTPYASVTLVAGKEIVFSGETSINTGLSDFHAYIQECGDAHRLSTSTQPKNVENNNYLEFQNSNDENISVNKTRILDILPNPNNGNFTIIMNEKEEALKSIEIQNSLGMTIQTISQPKSSKIDINIQDQASGLYLVKLNYTDKVITKKIVKQ